MGLGRSGFVKKIEGEQKKSRKYGGDKLRLETDKERLTGRFNTMKTVNMVLYPTGNIKIEETSLGNDDPI